MKSVNSEGSVVLFFFRNFSVFFREYPRLIHSTPFKRKHKNKTFWTLADLCKILKSGRHQMLSKLYSLSIASLRKLDEEANKFYDRSHVSSYSMLHSTCSSTIY